MHLPTASKSTLCCEHGRKYRHLRGEHSSKCSGIVLPLRHQQQRLKSTPPQAQPHHLPQHDPLLPLQLSGSPQLTRQLQPPQPPQLPRRNLLLAGTLSTLGVLYPMVLPVPPVLAAIIDEENSVATFITSSASAVAVKLAVDGRLERQGSGFVWDSYGHVVTDERLTSKKPGIVMKVVVTNVNGEALEVEAVLCGTSTAYSIAVLRVDDEVALAAMRSVTVCPSKQVKVGQSVYALGQLNGSKSMSAGIISGLNRNIPSSVGTLISGVLQTDAQINGINSGGPLVDSSGHLIGMSIAPQYSVRQGGSGINFAVPSDIVLDIVPKLAAFGNASGKGV